MRTLLIGLMLLVWGPLAFGQTVLLEEDVNADTIPSNMGPDKKNFIHSYMGYGIAVDESENKGSAVKIGTATNEYKFGLRYKRKIAGFYSLAVDLAYSRSNYTLKQSAEKVLPDTLQHDREWMVFHQTSILLVNRFNFGRQGNSLGKYLDLGGYGDWVFSARHRTRDELPSPTSGNAEIMKATYTGLKYVEPFNYGLIGRFGVKWFSIYGKYRLSDRFKSNYGYAELPRLTLGIEIAFSS